MLRGRSRCPRISRAHIAREWGARIVQMRHELSARYRRTVGPRTISLYLRREAGPGAPSPSSVWRVLRQQQQILTIRRPVHEPFQCPLPGAVWEIDFCTLSRQSADAPDKKANALEAFNIVDEGSSAPVHSVASVAYDAQHTFEALAEAFQWFGVPRALVLDRDPRFVGSVGSDPFPSWLERYCRGVGCEPVVCPPRRPDLKPMVERFHLNLRVECFNRIAPPNAAAANALLLPYLHWYNEERPHQGRDLAGSPPGPLFRQGPPRPPLPDQVDPDAWLLHYHHKTFRRQVDRRGSVQLWKQSYYLGVPFAHQQAVLRLDAHARCFEVELGLRPFKTLPLKGLVGHPLEYADFRSLILDEAESEWRAYLRRQRLQAVARLLP